MNHGDSGLAHGTSGSPQLTIENSDAIFVASANENKLALEQIVNTISERTRGFDTRLWREYFGDKAIMINDDKPFIQITETGAVFHGTPYNGKHRIGNKISVPLKAVCILERAEENHIERITKADAYTMLVQQILRPREPAQMAKTMQLIDKLAERVELYRLGCNMDISAAEVAYNGMKG